MSEAGHIRGHLINRPQHDGRTRTVPITPYDTIMYPCQRHKKSKSSPRPAFFAAQAKNTDRRQSTARNDRLGETLYSTSSLDMLTGEIHLGMALVACRESHRPFPCFDKRVLCAIGCFHKTTNDMINGLIVFGPGLNTFLCWVVCGTSVPHGNV